MTPAELFDAHRELVQKLAECVCRRYHFSRDETEDFVSTVMLKLIADDYGVLRRYEGRSGSKLTTYLAVVVQHEFQDHVNRLWGKWRPSREAVRRGPLAVRLEQLMMRDGKSFDEACQILRNNDKVEASIEELEALAAALPRRPPPRRIEGEEALRHLAASESADAHLLGEERQALREKVQACLRQALDGLPDEDRVIVRMQFEDGLKVVQIAQAVHLEQKPLYRRIERIGKSLRQELERRGIRREDIDEVLGQD